MGKNASNFLPAYMNFLEEHKPKLELEEDELNRRRRSERSKRRRKQNPGQVDPEEEGYFTQPEQKQVLDVIRMYQDNAMPEPKSKNHKASSAEYLLKFDRLTRGTFCRFLLDLDLVELDAAMVAKMGDMAELPTFTGNITQRQKQQKEWEEKER